MSKQFFVKTKSWVIGKIPQKFLPNKAKFFRYACVGVSCTILDFTLFNLFVLGSLPILLANSLAIFMSTICSYFLNKKWVFKVTTVPARKEVVRFGRYLLVTGLGVLIIQNSVIATIHRLYYEHEFSFMAANLTKLFGVFASAIFNYLLYNYVVFDKGEVELEAELFNT